jgi:hypothetical protein
LPARGTPFGRQGGAAPSSPQAALPQVLRPPAFRHPSAGMGLTPTLVGRLRWREALSMLIMRSIELTRADRSKIQNMTKL